MIEEKTLENIKDIEKYLRRIDHTIRRKGREILKDFDITLPQFAALQILIHNKTMTIGELSQKMDLACSTITDLIDRMEKSNLVIRKRDKNDRRVVKVEVLPKGHNILNEVLKKRVAYLDGKLKRFDKEARVDLNTTLKSL